MIKMISYRDIVKTSGIEMTQSGIGISSSVRIFMRYNDPNAAGLENQELNEMIAKDFSNGTPEYRFRLNRGERKGVAEVRKSGAYFYIAFLRGRGTAEHGYDILVVQRDYKAAPTEGLRKRRLQPGWGFDFK